MSSTKTPVTLLLVCSFHMGFKSFHTIIHCYKVLIHQAWPLLKIQNSLKTWKKNNKLWVIGRNNMWNYYLFFLPCLSYFFSWTKIFCGILGSLRLPHSRISMPSCPTAVEKCRNYWNGEVVQIVNDLFKGADTM